MLFDLTPEMLLFAVFVFLLAGAVKGIIGIGLPLICVPLLSGLVGPITAMALMAVPITGVNIWQMVQSGRFRWAVGRFWSAIPALIVGTVIGLIFLTNMEIKTLTLVVGAIVILMSLIQLFPVKFAIAERQERWMTPGIGLASGVMGGVSSFLGPLMTVYLVALRIDKDQFIGTIAMIYFISALPFFGGLALTGHLGWNELLASTAGTAVILVGVVAGQVLRKAIPPERFRRAVLAMMILIGANMIRKGLM
ncbi:MAG: sulfite exporter TauE/SafE family protein [Alphaproteobacteria bacterium]|nr:sulfite exporter TauE/SafE family protein [Alphaproteobacteria bacterium]